MKRPRDRRGPPAVVYPKRLCVGGPRDGETLSILDLPMMATVTPGRIARREHYIRATRDGVEIWLWREIQG